MELQQLLESLIQQIPVIAVLAWLVAKQGREIELWQQRYFDLNQRMIDVLKEVQHDAMSNYRTLSAIERRRSEHALPEIHGVSDRDRPRQDTSDSE